MLNKKIISVAAALLLASSISMSSAFASDLSKIKHLQIGDTLLILEAPSGRCFMNQTTEKEKAAFGVFEAQFNSGGKKQIMAAFSDCSKISKYLEDSDIQSLTENIGFISWLNPDIGITYEGSHDEFSKMVLAKIKKSKLQEYKKLDNGAAYLIRQSYRKDDKTIKQFIVTAFTTIRHVPLEIIMQIKVAGEGDTKEAFEKVNKFINYHTKINE